MFKLMAALSLVMAAYLPTASADVHRLVGPAWVCSMHGNLSGYSISPLISIQSLRGVGVLSCETTDNERVDFPVIMKLSGLGLGLGFSKIENVSIYTASIGVANDPYALIGSYSVGATAGATLIAAGVNFDSALNVKKDGGASFDIGLKGLDAKGLELKLQGMVFEVQRYVD